MSNRIIKFRAWDGTKMYVPILFGGNIYRTDRDYEDGNAANDDILMQYIGTEDKNGYQAFEGDIVRVRGTKKVGEYVTTIIWGGHGWKFKENKTYINDHFFPKNIFEVIGDIYNTPELLNLK